MTNKNRLEAIRNLKPMPESERHKYNISDVEVGGYFSFRNQNWQVVDKSRYLDVKWNNFARRKKEEWTIELTILSLENEETRYIEYYEDDSVEIYFTEREIKLRELGVTRKDLEKIADEEKGTISLDEKPFYYYEDETWAALYFREGDEEGIPVRFYEFEANDGTCLTVEAWHDNVSDDRPERESFISSEISSGDITILQLSTRSTQ